MAIEVRKYSKLTVVISLALILVLNGSSLSNTSFQGAFASTEDNCCDEDGNYICTEMNEDQSADKESSGSDPNGNASLDEYCYDEEGQYTCPSADDSDILPSDDVPAPIDNNNSPPDNQPDEDIVPPPDNQPADDPPRTDDLPP